MSESANSARTDIDPERDRVVKEEQACLERVQQHVRQKAAEPAEAVPSYDAELLSLRDEIATARQEDLPPLVEEMTRLSALAARRHQATQGTVDLMSPYFGHLVLEESGRKREVLIGRGTYLDTKAGLRIVDWRDAPVSRIYYRYNEGDDYEETFGDREVVGLVRTRRAVTITSGELRRIVAPQGSFLRTRGGWKRLAASAARLQGGEGMAPRPERQRGRLGVGEEVELGEDKHLREITPLIDPRQFELITRPDSGVVVIQGGAGSGKTTVGLHRMAYLAFNNKERFRPDKMLVVVFNSALARYMSQLLPTLGVNGVAIRTYEEWAGKLRTAHFPQLPSEYNPATAPEISRLKKHPTMLKLIDGYVEELAARLERDIVAGLEKGGSGQLAPAFARQWQASSRQPLLHRVNALRASLEGRAGADITTNARVALERVVRDGTQLCNDILGAWADILTDRERLRAAFSEFSADEVNRLVIAANAHCQEVLGYVEEHMEAQEAVAEATTDERSAGKQQGDEDAASDESEDDRSHGVDGRMLEEQATLDREDDALLLRLMQRLIGPLRRHAKSKEVVSYEHVFIDETQDLSPVELAVLLDCVTAAKCVTFAGDVAQRVLLDNGFSNWKTVLAQLGLSHVEVEPLKLSYRSTRQILELACHVLGPLQTDTPPIATRDGASVELFCFSHTGDAASFLAEALRDLRSQEPRASVCVIARYPEQADAYYHALLQAEIPELRRIADQDFPFRPGVDVTDVRQVKGLEFDYVVVVEVNESSYPPDDEARHLLHIAITRAAHQVWLLATGRPSPLLPEALREEAC